MAIELPSLTRPTHDWLRQIEFARVEGPTTPMLERVDISLTEHLRRLGHRLQSEPANNTDVLVTTAPFGRALNWREAPLFTARLHSNLRSTPTVYSLIHATTHEFDDLLDHFDRALAKDPLEPSDYDFDGLGPQAYRTLVAQGRRGGPILALARLLQAQSKSIRIILIVGDECPSCAYYFDLVGSHPRVNFDDPELFYGDMAIRIVTSVSTGEVTDHEVLDDPVPSELWNSLSTPNAMTRASRELGRRSFFTHIARIADLVKVPAMNDAVAEQYSEGCYATWDPTLAALISTVTGSARPVEKENISSDDLAVIAGVRADRRGAVVRHVEGKRNDAPSSEAVEMMDMDTVLPKLDAATVPGATKPVPVVRSKLHGHRGVNAYNPNRVEFVRLDTPYYHYPVSCATEAQAQAIKDAFARSEALRYASDHRQVVFTVLPGHGVVIAEKWVNDKVPFQMIWEYMDSGDLQIGNRIPQGLVEYALDDQGLMRLVASNEN